MNKKHIVAALCALLSAFVLKAQTIHRDYRYIGKMNTGQSVTVVHTDDDASAQEIFFVSVERDTNGSYIDRSVITKTDAAGNFMMAVRRDSSNGMERIFTTYDKNILLLSLFGNRMVVTKYDRNLNQMWSMSIPHTAGWVHRGYHYMDMEKVHYPNPDYNPDLPPHEPNGQPVIENYILTYPVSSDIGDLWNDVTTKAARVDNMGNLVWAKTYDIYNRSYYNMRDFACAITSFEDNGTKYFPIVGGRNTQLTYPMLFAFLIDDNGVMQSPFTTIETDGYEPFVPDVVYDPNTDSLLIVYTEESGSLNPGHAFNVSGNSVIKIDKYLNGGRGRYFFHDCENYANSISLLSDGSYMIGGVSGQCTSTMGLYPATPTFLNLDANLDQNFFKRYSPYKGGGWSESVHCTDNQDYSYLLSYVWNISPWPYVLLSQDIKLIKADLNGKACQHVSFQMTPINFEPEIATEEYETFDWPQQDPVHITEIHVNPEQIYCSDADGSKPSDVRMVKPAMLTAKVLPTLIQNRNAENIVCTVESPLTGNVQVSIHNQVGQEVYRMQHAVKAGSNTISISAASLSGGMNIVRIVSNGQVVNTSKVVVAD